MLNFSPILNTCTFPAGSNLSTVLFSTVIRNLGKLSWFLLRSLLLSKLMFSCWPLFVAEAAVTSFEFCCDLLFIFMLSVFVVSLLIFCFAFKLFF